MEMFFLPIIVCYSLLTVPMVTVVVYFYVWCCITFKLVAFEAFIMGPNKSVLHQAVLSWTTLFASKLKSICCLTNNLSRHILSSIFCLALSVGSSLYLGRNCVFLHGNSLCKAV